MKIRSIPLSCMMAAFCFNACFADVDFEGISKLTLKGQATLHKPADQMSITIGVATIGVDAETALKENNEKMQAVVQSLDKIGLSKQEYETGQFSIRPIYSQQPKDAPEDWKPSIKGYEVLNNVNVKTTQLKLAGDLIDAASGAGANRIENINFDLKDPQIYRAEAITAASANALGDAHVLSKATSQRLVKVLAISLDEAQYLPPAPRPIAMYMAKGFAPAMASAPISAGNVEVSANVTIVYEIEPNQVKGQKLP